MGLRAHGRACVRRVAFAWVMLAARKSLVLVALLFLASTIVLFVHLQALGGEEEDVVVENIQLDSQAMDANQQHATSNNNSTDKPTQQKSSPENANQDPTITENINKASLDDVHVFYYPWYANEETDGKWNHWDHHILPHWNEQTRKQVYTTLQQSCITSYLCASINTAFNTSLLMT